MREPTRCCLLRTSQQLLSLLPQWNALWRSDPNGTPFQSPQWLLPWWSHFGEGSLRSAALFRGDSLAALLPFYLYTDPGTDPHTDPRHAWRKLLPLGVSTSDYLDGIFAPDCTPEDILPALQTLTADGGFDSFEVTQLRSSSLLAQALRLWNPGAFDDGSGESTTQRPAVPLASLPAKIRRNTRYYTARAEQIGKLEFCTAPAENALAAYESLERLHTLRWQQSGEPGVLADPRVRAWHRDAVPQLAAQGIARLYTLGLNGEPIAALYALLDPPGRENRTVYSYLTGFSTPHADLCPGTLLIAHVIDHAAREGFSTFDLLRGHEAYKNLWHPVRVPTHRFCAQQAHATETDTNHLIPVAA